MRVDDERHGHEQHRADPHDVLVAEAAAALVGEHDEEGGGDDGAEHDQRIGEGGDRGALVPQVGQEVDVYCTPDADYSRRELDQRGPDEGF